jgi:hypothetical protein
MVRSIPVKIANCQDGRPGRFCAGPVESVGKFDCETVACAQLLVLQEQSHGMHDSIPAIGGLEAFGWLAIAREHHR